MKYTAVLKDKNHKKVKSFWFRSQFDIGQIDKAMEIAEKIAEEQGYKYENISIHPKKD